MYKTNLYQRSIGPLDLWIKQRQAHQIPYPFQQLFVEAPVAAPVEAFSLQNNNGIDGET